MGNLGLDEVGIDQRHNLSAQRLILFGVLCIKGLEPDLEIRVTDENGWILLFVISLAFQEPALIWTRVFWVETRIQALDKISGEAIVDPRAIVLAKSEPRLALRIPDNVLPISSRAGDEEGPE
ncbi:hypothetical protein AAII07_58130 [Microvirga sp. 0TCS3.31]